MHAWTEYMDGVLCIFIFDNVCIKEEKGGGTKYAKYYGVKILNKNLPWYIWTPAVLVFEGGTFGFF